MGKIEEYLTLLSKSYDEAVEFLLEKYGAATDDYFREKSYERFLNGEIKRITKGNYTRSLEGLECHHIDETKFLNMSKEDFIKTQKIPFKYHRKERLVFCDIIEHTILHALIAKETSFKFGYPGYIVFLRPKLKEWYLDRIIPQKSRWHITCYHKSYLTPEEVSELLEKMDSMLLTEEVRINQEKQKIIEKKLEKTRIMIQKGGFKNLNNNSSPQKVIRAMYDLNKMGASGYLRIFNEFVYSEKYERKIIQPVEFEVFERELKEYDFGGIIKNIHLYIKYIEGVMSKEEYLSQKDLYSKTKKQIEDEQKALKEKERIEKMKREAFYSEFPKLEKIGIEYNVKRQEVNALLFKNNDKYSSFIKFQSAMKLYSLNELLAELHRTVKE